MKPAEIKRRYNETNEGHFFDPETMKWFGDEMSSFDTIELDGDLYMFRKPSAYVNVFGTRKRAGRDYFNAWEVKVDESGVLELSTVSKAREIRIYQDC